MHYHCPEAADIADVCALNREFLSGLDGRELSCLKGLDADPDTALTRLASTPCLLYALETPDAGFWDRAFRGRTDLLDNAGSSTAPDAGLVASTLGFLWHLSRRDLHAARLFTGYSDDWCRRLAATPLIVISNRVLGAGVRPVLRMDASDPRWRSMVRTVACRDKASRLAAAMRVVHALLLPDTPSPSMASAACRIRSPARQFAVRETD